MSCGSGGVGKTTISAAVALEGARVGRRSCVVTIDPARRLADSLGLSSLGNTANRIPGPWSGELWALQLDPKSTFDDLVGKYADTPEQADGILRNRIYRNLTEALSGTQEYMAMEKLYELAEEDRFDLIVVDTPPSRNALDFLEAPNRLTRFLGNRIFQFLLMPTRASLRAFSLASQALLKTISRVAGAEIVNDAVAFFQAFAGMEEGFRLRARHVRDLLADDATSFVLVSAPRLDTVTEAGWFAGRLEEAGLAVDALVVNRVHPVFWKKVDELPDVDPGSNSATSSRTSANLRGELARARHDRRARRTGRPGSRRPRAAPRRRRPRPRRAVRCRRRPLRAPLRVGRLAFRSGRFPLVTATAGRG